MKAFFYKKLLSNRVIGIKVPDLIEFQIIGNGLIGKVKFNDSYLALYKNSEDKAKLAAFVAKVLAMEVISDHLINVTFSFGDYDVVKGILENGENIVNE